MSSHTANELVALKKTNQHLQTQIWERERAAEALRESDERHQMLFRESPLPMWVIDLKTLAFLAVNEAAIRSYGYAEEELLAMSLKDLHCADEMPELLERFSQANARRPCNGFVTKHRKKDGGIITVEISSRVISYNGRDAKLALANDVTEKKKLEAQCLRAQRIEATGTLATGMAHDLNNILTPILMSAGILRLGLSKAEQEKAINRIEVNVKRGSDIIQQVLAFGRCLNGPATPEAVESAAPYVPPELPRGDGEAVLIVDDEPEIVSGMKEMLEKQNYRVLAAKNGLEGLAVVRRHGPAIDLVMTDVMMPEMDGVEMIRVLRQTHPRLKIIASSGLGTEQGGSMRGRELEALGVKSFLPKPYSADKLLEELHHLLRNGQAIPA